MGGLRVNPDDLRLASQEYAQLVERLQGILRDLESAAAAAPSYDGQFGPRLWDFSASATTLIQRIQNEMIEASEYLDRTAEAFAEADAAGRDGFYQLALAMRRTVDQLGSLSSLPQWLVLGQRPPWVEPERWKLLHLDERHAMLEDYRRAWAQFLAARTEGSFRASQEGLPYLEEMFSVYLFGLPMRYSNLKTGQQSEPYVPAVSLFALPRLPDGNTAYGEDRFNRYQYQDLRLYLEALSASDNPDDSALAERVLSVKTQDWASAHRNLCGLDAVGYAAGARDMMEIYVAFAAVNEETLITGDTAWTYEIRDLYREMGWQADQIGRFASSEYATWLHWDEENRLAFPTFEDLERKLAEGYAITPLVGVDSAAGTLSADPDAAVGHFVTISETMEAQDGTQLIRVYNSLEHREEIYTWEWFDQIWRNAGGNSGGQAAIARPPEVEP